MVFNATFNNISVISLRSILLVEETGAPGENDQPVAGHCRTLSHNVYRVHLACEAGFEFTTLIVISTDCIGINKFNYHTIKATTAPSYNGNELKKTWNKCN